MRIIELFYWLILAFTLRPGASGGVESVSPEDGHLVETARSSMGKRNLQCEGTECTKERVVVIGAGFAGLSVAYHLIAHGNRFEVTILEGKGRIGGRVWPYSGLTLSGDDKDVQVDLGAQWIHGGSEKNPIRILMEKLQVPVFRKPEVDVEAYDNDDITTLLGKDHVVYDEDGSAMDKGVFRRAGKVFKDIYNQEGLSKDVVIDVNTTLQDIRASYDLPSGNTCETSTFDRALNYLFSRSEATDGGSAEEVSASLDELYESFGGGNERVEGGYGVLMDALRMEIGPEKIRLNSVVTKIQYSAEDGGGGVRVHLSSGEEVQGDVCIFTPSLGVLQHRKLRFEPDLPTSRWDAIDKMGMGLMDKVAMRFPTNFWHHHSFGIANSDPLKIKFFLDHVHMNNEPVLLMFQGANAARRIDSAGGDAMDDDIIVEEILDSLRAIFGVDAVPIPLAFKVTRWNVDPFALGAYSFPKAGCTEETYDVVASPVGNLRFAGEGTVKAYYGCVHAAWISGQREAQRLIEKDCSSRRKSSSE